jgi:hypothetical protein
MAAPRPEHAHATDRPATTFPPRPAHTTIGRRQDRCPVVSKRPLHSRAAAKISPHILQCAISSIDVCIASACSGLQLIMNDVVFAADLWNLVLDSTAKCHDWPMGPGTLSFFLAQLVLGSVVIEYLSLFSLIPSRLTNAISSAYERHLRKPQNTSFPNQYLQELGGETTALLSFAIYMADSSSSNKEQALVIVVPVGLSPELQQCARVFSCCGFRSYSALFVGCYLQRISRNKTHQLDGVVSIHAQYA